MIIFKKKEEEHMVPICWN